MGCVEVLQSMRALDFNTRTQVTRSVGLGGGAVPGFMRGGENGPLGGASDGLSLGGKGG